MACHLPARNSEASSFAALAQHLLLQSDYQLEAMEPSTTFSSSSSSRREAQASSFPHVPAPLAASASLGAFSNPPPGPSSALFEDASTPDWMDALMSNLPLHAGYFNDNNPCESTESSDLPAAAVAAAVHSHCGGDGGGVVAYPCSPLEDFSLDFYNSNEMLGNNNNNYYYMQEDDPLVPLAPPPPPSMPHFNPARALREINTVRPNVAAGPAVKPMVINEPMWAWNYSAPASVLPPPKPGVKSGLKREAGSSDPSSSSSSHSLQLLNILCECAKTVDSQPATTEAALSRLCPLSSPIGDPIQRLSSYFADALHKRLLNRKQKQINSKSICSIEEYTLAYKAFNDACPYFKFAHLTANEAILEAMDCADKIHIVDFGISHGVQWAALLQALASRPAGKPVPRIRLTGIASPSLGPDRERDSLIATGKRLTEFAKLLELEFEFHPIWVAMELVEPSMVQIEDGERVAVNFMLELSQLLGDNSDALKATLKTVEAMAPEVVTLAEFDVSLNNIGGFQKRFLNALQFYLAVFESLEATMARESAERIKVERWFFGEGMIEEIVSCEGPERKRRLEGREQWRAIMESAGFRASRLSNYAVSQARLLLWLYCEAFTLLQGQDQTCLSLAWHNRPILTISAWTPLASPPPPPPPQS